MHFPHKVFFIARTTLLYIIILILTINLDIPQFEIYSNYII